MRWTVSGWSGFWRQRSSHLNGMVSPFHFEAKMNLSLHPSAQIDAGLLCGYNVVIEEGVRIGVACRIGHGVIIHGGTQSGDKVRIDDHAVIGKLPMRSARSVMTVQVDLPPCIIRDH